MIQMCAAKKLMVRTVYQRKERMRMETKQGLEEEKVGEKGEGQRSEWKESESACIIVNLGYSINLIIRDIRSHKQYKGLRLV